MELAPPQKKKQTISTPCPQRCWDPEEQTRQAPGCSLQGIVWCWAQCLELVGFFCLFVCCFCFFQILPLPNKALALHPSGSVYRFFHGWEKPGPKRPRLPEIQDPVWRENRRGFLQNAEGTLVWWPRTKAFPHFSWCSLHSLWWLTCYVVSS